MSARLAVHCTPPLRQPQNEKLSHFIMKNSWLALLFRKICVNAK